MLFAMARKRNDDLAYAIGQRVKGLRKAAGLTQEQLAEAIDLQPSAISRFENGSIGLSITTLQQAARVLRVPLARIFEEPGEPAPASADPEEAMVLQAWRTLPEAYRVHLRAVLRWAQEATAFAEAQAVYERVRVAGPRAVGAGGASGTGGTGGASGSNVIGASEGEVRAAAAPGRGKGARRR
jgi:transcriptional regulator with XRE-family HTH domain